MKSSILNNLTDSEMRSDQSQSEIQNKQQCEIKLDNIRKQLASVPLQIEPSEYTSLVFPKRMIIIKITPYITSVVFSLGKHFITDIENDQAQTHNFTLDTISVCWCAPPATPQTVPPSHPFLLIWAFE